MTKNVPKVSGVESFMNIFTELSLTSFLSIAHDVSIILTIGFAYRKQTNFCWVTDWPYFQSQIMRYWHFMQHFII